MTRLTRMLFGSREVHNLTVNRRHWWAAVSLLAALSTGCADPNKVAAIEKRASDLEIEVKALSKSVKTLEQTVAFNEATKNWDAIAYLTPGTEGYTVIQTDLGRMTVKLVNVEPYANGSRVTLQFGNLTSATVNGASAKLEWGSVDEKGSPKNESAKSRDFKFSESLRAAAWTNIQVVLEAVPPSDLGFVRVKELTHSGIVLLR